jgi:hypothetical protein
MVLLEKSQLMRECIDEIVQFVLEKKRATTPLFTGPALISQIYLKLSENLPINSLTYDDLNATSHAPLRFDLRSVASHLSSTACEVNPRPPTLSAALTPRVGVLDDLVWSVENDLQIIQKNGNVILKQYDEYREDLTLIDNPQSHYTIMFWNNDEYN